MMAVCVHTARFFVPRFLLAVEPLATNWISLTHLPRSSSSLSYCVRVQLSTVTRWNTSSQLSLFFFSFCLRAGGPSASRQLDWLHLTVHPTGPRDTITADRAPTGSLFVVYFILQHFIILIALNKPAPRRTPASKRALWIRGWLENKVSVTVNI